MTGTVSSLTVTGPWSLRLDAPAVVGGGQAVPLRLVLTNTGEKTLRIELPGDQRHRADFVVMRGSTEVWEKLRGAMSLDFLWVMHIAPNDSVVFQDLWPQRTNRRRLVSPGKYTVKGIVFERTLTKSPGGMVSAPVEVIIR